MSFPLYCHFLHHSVDQQTDGLSNGSVAECSDTLGPSQTGDQCGSATASGVDLTAAAQVGGELVCFILHSIESCCGVC